VCELEAGQLTEFELMGSLCGEGWVIRVGKRDPRIETPSGTCFNARHGVYIFIYVLRLNLMQLPYMAI
jgi:hypothetical protein